MPTLGGGWRTSSRETFGLDSSHLLGKSFHSSWDMWCWEPVWWPAAMLPWHKMPQASSPAAQDPRGTGLATSPTYPLRNMFTMRLQQQPLWTHQSLEFQTELKWKALSRLMECQ